MKYMFKTFSETVHILKKLSGNVTCMSVNFDWILDWILNLLTTLAHIVITLNYSPIANFHTLQFTTARSKSFPAGSVFTSSSLVTASNNGYSSASGFKPFLIGGYLPTEHS
jgi:hypothetical protein